jgi:hypothetical protein
MKDKNEVAIELEFLGEAYSVIFDSTIKDKPEPKEVKREEKVWDGEVKTKIVSLDWEDLDVMLRFNLLLSYEEKTGVEIDADHNDKLTKG